VRDLDGDGEPEVLLDLYTNGAHCCFYTNFYAYDSAGNRYAGFRHKFADAEYRLKDLGHDSRLEVITSDARFAYAFTSYADSFLPIRIFRYRNRRLVLATRKYRSAIKRDARHILRFHRSLIRQHRDVRGMWAAWLADQYLLHRRRSGLKRIEAARRRGELRDPSGLGSGPSGKKYIRALKRLLRRKGYA
jgi:hypothetical protein